jgi:hypothetical protein
MAGATTAAQAECGRLTANVSMTIGRKTKMNLYELDSTVRMMVSRS